MRRLSPNHEQPTVLKKHEYARGTRRVHLQGSARCGGSSLVFGMSALPWHKGTDWSPRERLGHRACRSRRSGPPRPLSTCPGTARRPHAVRRCAALRPDPWRQRTVPAPKTWINRPARLRDGLLVAARSRVTCRWLQARRPAA
eukprot:6173257-Pleurochrysis_carterae.AAC.1